MTLFSARGPRENGGKGVEFLSALWMPIVVSAVFVWIASFFMHMVFPHHKSEWKGLPDEAKVLAALEGIPAGQYMFPWGTMADMKSPEFIAKQEKGPVGTLGIWSGRVNMGANLLLTFIFFLVVSVFVGYLGWHSLPPASHYLKVFQICGAASFMAHGMGWMPNVIWFRTKGFWANVFDALVYAGVTAGTFGWLWPK